VPWILSRTALAAVLALALGNAYAQDAKRETFDERNFPRAFGTLEWLLLTLLNVTPAAMSVEQFENSLLKFAVLQFPFSIALGALCVGILSYTY